MKKIITIIVALLIIIMSGTSMAKPKNTADAKYYPVVQFVEYDSTLSQWYKQYIDTTKSNVTFNDFLKRLSTSEVLYQRSKRAGIEHNQLYSPLLLLVDKNWKQVDRMNSDQIENIRASMIELDIALGAIEATLPQTAYEEFRREVIRGAKPLTEIAEKPKTAIDFMTFTLMDHRVSDRLNQPVNIFDTPSSDKATRLVRPPELRNSWFSPW